MSSATYVSYPGGGGGKVAETKLVDEPSKVAAAEDGVEEPVLAPCASRATLTGLTRIIRASSGRRAAGALSVDSRRRGSRTL